MRKRFTKEERTAFISGTPVEWRNGSHWLAARLIGDVFRNADGWDQVPLVVEVTTRTVSPASGMIYGRPTAVRLRPAPMTQLDRFRAASTAHEANRKGE